MSGTLIGWSTKGFSKPPEIKVAPKEGVEVYRCWGGGSSEAGSGYFSLERPASVLDAELRFNIADWGNRIFFLSVFRILYGTSYWVGPVLHHAHDHKKVASQVFVEGPLSSKVLLVSSKLPLKQDYHVMPSNSQTSH